MTTVNTLKTVFLITLMTVLLVFIGNLIGGRTGMIIALVFAVGMNFFSYWFSDKIVLKMYKAEEVNEASNPRLYRIVRNLATRAGLPMPKVYIIMNGTPNAFATGRNKNHAAVAVTNTLMNMLDDDELAGVIGHELAHIYGKDILIGTIVAMMAGTIMTIVDIFQWSMILGGGNSDNEDGNPLGFIGSIAMIILAPLAATLIQMAVSRSREYIADQRGAEFCGNPKALASALHKIAYGIEMHPMAEAKPATAHMFIANPFAGQKMMSLFSTHPPIDDRINKPLNKCSLNAYRNCLTPCPEYLSAMLLCLQGICLRLSEYGRRAVHADQAYRIVIVPYSLGSGVQCMLYTSHTVLQRLYLDSWRIDPERAVPTPWLRAAA